MAKTIIGRNLPLYKGEYSSATVYDRFDVVLYDGSSYVSKLPNNQNKPVTNTTYWQLLAQRGEFTEQQLEDFKAEVVAESKEEMDDYTDDKKDELNAYTNTKETELNAYATALKNTFDTNASTKTSDFNNNATAKTTAFNTNASDKTDTFDTNASTKTTAFNDNATSKTTAFNTNATNKTTDFNDNATAKTTAFDTNATNKTNAFDDNASDKTDDFNDNATAKTTEFDGHVEEKTEEFDENAESLQQEIDELSENMPWNTTEQATEISVDDAAKYSRNKLELFGNTSQDSTSIDGGDEYDSPSSDHPQPIHVVTGENTIEIQGENLFDKNNFNIKNLNGHGTAGSYGQYTAATQQKHIYIPCKPNTDYVVIKDVTSVPQLGVNQTSEIPAIGVSYTSLYYSSNSSGKIHIKTNALARYLDITINIWEISQNLINKIAETLFIAEGTNVNMPYIPYYHTDYPIDLRGKNKFDITKITLNTYIGNNGTTGTSVATNLSDYIYVQGNKEYTLSYKCDNFENSSNRSLVFYTLNKQHISGVSYNLANKLFTFTPTQDGYIRFGYDINCYDIQVEEGSVTEYEPYNSIELCEIGDYQDKFVKDNGVWKIPNKIVKIDSYNGETITTPYISTTGGLDMGATVYYVGKEDYIITDETLIAQLDEIYEYLKLVKGTNNISITASDLAPNMELTYMQDLPTKLNNLASRIELLEE